MKMFVVKKMKFLPLVLVLGALPMHSAQAHGYVIGSRAAECMVGGNNKNCGPVMYEPQSVEASACQLVDGHIASGGVGRFSQIDEQSPHRWATKDFKTGSNKFYWKFTAPHPVLNFTASITKQDWDPSKAPKISDFGADTVLDAKGQTPALNKTLELSYDIPASSSGHNLILFKWRVADTGHCFVSVVDANVINADAAPGPDVADSQRQEQWQAQWQDIGAIHAAQDLLAKSYVRARFFTKRGEDVRREVRIDILKDGDGKQTVWPYLLAQKINQQMKGAVRVGKRDEHDAIEPVHDGANRIYIAKNSDLVQVEITPEPFVAPQQPAIQVPDLKAEYSLEDASQPFTLEFKVLAQHSKMSVTALVYQDGKIEAGSSKSVDIASGASKMIPLQILKPVFGSYTLVVRATDAAGQPVRQESKTFVLKKKASGPSYDYKYPEGVGTYKAGTVVLAADGKLYKAKPFPYLGWANQNNAAYKPGAGYAWAQAWDKM